jgi:DHA1 family inner membrane transport protein
LNPRIFLLPIGAFAVGTGNIVFVGVLEPLARDLDVSIAAAGQLATTFAIAYAVSAPVLVALTTRLPRRPVLVVALAAFAAANIGMALAPGFAWLVPLRIGAAFAAALYMPVAMGTAVSLADPAHKGRAMAVVLFGLTAAFLGGIPLGTWIGSLLGWRASFAFAAVLAVLGVLALAPGLPRLPGRASRGLRGIGVIRRPAVAGNLAITALAFVAVFCVNAYIGPVLSRAAGLEGSGIAAMQVLLGVGSVLGVPLGGWIADRRPTLGVVALLLVTIVAAQPVYSLLMLVPGWSGGPAAIAAAGLALTAASAALFALGPVQQERLIGVGGDERDIVLSLNASALFLGQGLGAAAGGVTTELLGLGATGLTGAAIALATLAGIGRVLLRRGRAAQHVGQPG